MIPHGAPAFLSRVLLAMAGLMLPGPGDEGRTYLNRVWQMSEGLSNNGVNSICQDAQGYIWAATFNGIDRFDGMKFENFTTRDGLPSNHVVCVFADSRGRLWVGTIAGIAWRENGTWKKLPDGPKGNAYLREASDGTIWAACDDQIWKISGDRATHMDVPGSNPNLHALLPDDAGGMWILGRSNVYHCTRDGEPQELRGPWTDDLEGLTRDREGRLVVCGNGMIVRRDADGWTDLCPLIPGSTEDAIHTCMTTADGTLWLATRNAGLVYLDGKATDRLDTPATISVNDTRCLFIDRQGSLWVGTNGGGLNQLRRRMFDSYGHAEGLGRAVTTAIVSGPDGVLRIGTNGSGVVRKEGARFVPDLRGTGLPERVPVWSMAYDKEGALWVGAYRDPLFRVKDGRASQVASMFPEGAPYTQFLSLHASRDGGLLLGMSGYGLRRLEGGSCRVLLEKPYVWNIYDTLEDSHGNLWAAAGREGVWLSGKEGWRDMRPETGVAYMNAAVLTESAGRGVWIGTLGQGLIQWRDGRAKRWTGKEGLVNDAICQIEADDRGYLWLATEGGLQRLELAELENSPGLGGPPLHGVSFSHADGLPPGQFTTGHGTLSLKAPDGSLWFSLSGGAIHVDPAVELMEPAAPVVHIESAANNRGRLWQFETATTRDRLVQPAGAGTLLIHFTAPYFIHPEKLRFRYRMSGLETEWREAGSERTAGYAMPPPGEYRFEVMAATSGSGWPATPTVMTVVVQPFFWQTVGFRVIATAAGFIALGIGMRTWTERRMKRRMARLEEETRLERERRRIASDLHDDLGATLSEINFIGTFSAVTYTDHPVRDNLQHIVTRAQRMAKSLDEIVWTVNPTHDNLSSVARYLCSRSQESLRTAGIRCRLDVSEDLPEVTFDSQLRHHLLMAVNEIIHNVMKHSGATECMLSIHREQDELVISVRDNGRGFRRSECPADRNGLTNLERRMNEIHGSFEITSTPGQGTLAVLRSPLPLQK
ncbi:hypothetical protein KBB96_09795 [Luteolibacter ambystomatis]|uniref:Histidine kinase domain-containing protein n=1 Tax=Luteolibacter ambystomatis TaxID=2824561 RepID=A0A975J336_9BACT|nr:sensor histidine kinase [Luteolibacter ambystomatis]QUE53173.1 hypothetical protein KBB96_09795 [Luteolibacter ambystomatis]